MKKGEVSKNQLELGASLLLIKVSGSKVNWIWQEY